VVWLLYMVCISTYEEWNAVHGVPIRIRGIVYMVYPVILTLEDAVQYMVYPTF
jgi:hypothetical protein